VRYHQNSPVACVGKPIDWQRLIAGPGLCAICGSCIEAIVCTDNTRQELQGPLCHVCGKTREEVEHITYGPEGVHMCSQEPQAQARGV